MHFPQAVAHRHEDSDALVTADELVTFIRKLNLALAAIPGAKLGAVEKLVRLGSCLGLQRHRFASAAVAACQFV